MSLNMINVKKSLRRFLEFFLINFARNSRLYGLSPKRELGKLLSSLHPVTNGFDLVRIGGDRDGGYLLPNDFAGIKECYSPGSDSIWSFEKDLAERYNIKSYICDRISTRPENLTEKQHFTDAWLGQYTDNEGTLSLEDWISTVGSTTGDLILQMDIEGSEFGVISSLSTETLKRFRIIVIELHHLEALKNRWAFEEIYNPFFVRLLDIFDVVHLHPNNCCGYWSYGKISFPNIVEITLHRKDRSLLKSPEKRNQIRHLLDEQCVANKGDLNIDFVGFEMWPQTIEMKP